MKIIATILESLFGGTVIGYILYLRLFRYDLRRPLAYNLVENQQYLSLLFYMTMFAIFTILFIVNMRLLFDKPMKTRFTFIYKLSDFYNRSMVSFFAVLTYFIGKRENFGFNVFAKIIKFLYNHCMTITFIRIIITLLYIIPRFVIICAFSVDLFILNEFHYVYKLSFILLFPLLLIFMEGALKVFCQENFRIWNDILYVFNTTTNQKYNGDEYFDYIFSCKYKVQQTASDDIWVYTFKSEYVHEQDEFFAKINEVWDESVTIERFIYIYEDVLLKAAEFLRLYTILKGQWLKYYPVSVSFLYMLLWTYLIYTTW